MHTIKLTDFSTHFTRLSPIDIHIWIAPLFLSDSILADLSCVLSEAELYRAGRYRFDKDQKAYITSRAILRHLIGQYTACDSSRIEVSAGRYGKPYVVQPPHSAKIYFSISRSYTYGVYAFTQLGEIGIDIEKRQNTINPIDIAPTVLSPDEIGILHNSPPDRRCRVFYDLWVRKESLLKALGMGFYFSPRSVDVHFDEHRSLKIIKLGFENEKLTTWKVQDIAFDQKYSAALSAPNHKSTLNYYDVWHDFLAFSHFI